MTEFDEMEETYSDSEQDTDDEVMFRGISFYLTNPPPLHTHNSRGWSYTY